MPWPKGQPTEHLRVWSKEQEEQIRQKYDGNGSNLSNVLPFSASAIRNKAKRLGITNNSHFHHVTKTELPKLSEFELGYVAGFMDGEGSITYSSNASTKIQYRIQIANSDQDVILWLRQILGIGRLRIQKARKHQHLDSYVLNIERQGDVWGLLDLVIPYLKIKKQKAIGVLDILEQRYKDEKSVMISGGYSE